MANGKGSRERPRVIGSKQWSDNWDRAFAPKDSMGLTDKDREILNQAAAVLKRRIPDDEDCPMHGAADYRAYRALVLLLEGSSLDFCECDE